MGVRISRDGIDCCLPAAGEDEVQVGGDSARSSSSPPKEKARENSSNEVFEAYSPETKSPEAPKVASTIRERLNMVQVLGENANPEEAPQACSTLHTILRLDPAWQVRRQAAHSLRSLGYSAVSDAESELRASLEDPELAVRAAAALALNVHGFDISDVNVSGLPPRMATQVLPQPLDQNQEAAVIHEKVVPTAVTNETAQGIADGSSNGMHESEQDPRAVSFVIDLDKAGQSKLGLDLDITSPGFLQIIGIKEGLVNEWNSQNPSRQLMIGDKIVGVNGITQNSKVLVQEVVDAPRLQLYVERLLAASGEGS